MEIGYEIISTAILSLPLIQVEQLSVTGERNRLGSLSRNSVVRLTDRLDMTIVVDLDVKVQIRQNKNKILHIVHYPNVCSTPGSDVYEAHVQKPRLFSYNSVYK